MRIQKHNKSLTGVTSLSILIILTVVLSAIFALPARLSAAELPGPAPAVTANDTTNRVYGMSTGMEYNLNGAGYVPYSLTSFDTVSFAGTHTLGVRYKATADRPASQETILTFTADPPRTPPQPPVSRNDLANAVYGMTAEMEYKLDSAAFTPYSPAEFQSLSLSGAHTLQVRYRATATRTASTPASLAFTVNPPTAKVVFTFDDGWADTYTHAFPILRAAGYRGTVYVCRDLTIGTHPDIMRVSGLQFLYRHAWDISNHTTNHAEIGDQTDPASLALLRGMYLDNLNWIIDYCGPRGAFHAAYPSGKYTPELIEVLKGIGMMTGRAAETEGYQQTPVTNPADYFTMPVIPLENGYVPLGDEDPLPRAIAAIDEAIPQNGTVIFMIHRVLDAAGDLVLKTADFQAIISYIKSKGESVQVLSMSDWYKSASLTSQTPAMPPVTRDDDTNTVYGMAAGMEYNLDSSGYVPYDPTVFNALDLSGRHVLLVRQAAAGPAPAGVPAILLFSADPGAAKVVFTFDDGWKSQLDYAYPILAARGFKATAYVSRDLIGTSPDTMNTANLATLYAAGWDIGNRTYNRQNITGLDRSQILNLYSLNQAWLSANGWTRGMPHASYPDGLYSETLFDVLAELGILTGRTGLEADEGIVQTPLASTDAYYTLPQIAIYNDDPYYINKARLAVDQAVIHGRTVIFVMHRVEPGVTGPGIVLSTDGLEEIVDYVASYRDSGAITCLTMSEWLAAQASP